MKGAILPESYARVLKSLKDRIRQARIKATLSAHRQLIELYWHIGKVIVERQRNEGWGKSIVERLAVDLHKAFPDMGGLSPRNIWRMRAFHLAYTEDVQKLPRAVAELDGENLPLLSFGNRRSHEGAGRQSLHRAHLVRDQGQDTCRICPARYEEAYRRG